MATKIIEGFEFSFSRRRYGHTTYTWVQARHVGSVEWKSLGDPWPCVVPKKSELITAAAEVLS